MTFFYACVKFIGEGNVESILYEQKALGLSSQKGGIILTPNILICVHAHAYTLESLLSNFHLTGFPNPSGGCTD